MTLIPRIQEDIKMAMRARDAHTVSTLRMVTSALNYKRIESGAVLTDEQELEVLERQAKQRRESIEQYTAAGRPELAQKEAAELTIIERYLPEQLGRDAIIAEAQMMIAEVGATSATQIGKVMGPLSRKLKGRADGTLVRNIVVELLQTPR